MKRALLAVALLLSMASAETAQEKQQAAKLETAPAQLEARERKLWEAFKNKDKATLSDMLDGGFRQFEEGLSAFGDKKTEVNAVDDFELIRYTLSDFTVKSIGPDAALVTYIAQYEGKSGGEISKAKSVFGEVWIRDGNEWKELYMQETYVK
ncbi:MAG: nuclear transport factor 2 family protein [Candidatus Sulfotelmatobacter sp.]